MPKVQHESFELHRFKYPLGSRLEAGRIYAPGCARVVLADPPYNQGVKYAGDRSGDKMTGEQYRDLVMRALREQAVWLAPGGTCWWVIPPRHLAMIEPLMEAVIGPQLYSIAWYETFSNYNRRDLTKDWRVILVHTNDPKRVVRRMDRIRVPSARLLMKKPDKRADPRGRVPGSVWNIRRLQGTSTARVDWHDAQLPPELHQRIIQGWSDPGDIVADGFLGSGSMGVEAIKLGRRFFAVDQSAVYVRKATARLAEVDQGVLDA